MEVNATENCLAHAVIIEIAEIDIDANYISYRNGNKIRPIVRTLIQENGIDLSGDAWIPELVNFQEHFRDYKITLYQGLACEDIMFKGQVDPISELNYCTMMSKDTIT